MKDKKTTVSAILLSAAVVLVADPLLAQDAAPPVGESGDAPVSTTTEPGSTPPAATTSLPTEDKQWNLRLEQLEEGLLKGEMGFEEADGLYEELRNVLADKQRQLRKALTVAGPGEKKEDTLDLHETWNALYGIRVTLLETISPELRARVLGTGLTGVKELRAEVERVALEWNYQRALMPEQARDWWERIRQGPLPTLRDVAKLILLIIVLVLWLDWSRGGLPGLRTKILEIRPRTQNKLRLARFIWYVEQVRRPLGWLLFFEAVFAIPDLTPFEGPLERVSAVLRWALLIWLAISLLNALAARDKAGLTSESGRLRSRSLWLLASWALLLGLGLEIADAYTGRGTLYAWVWLSMQVLAVPVLVLLVVWCRPTVYAQLEQLQTESDWIRAVLSRRKGLRGFLGAATGGAYLLLREWALALIDLLAAKDWGRGLRSHLYRMSLTRLTAGEDPENGLTRLPDELRARLMSVPSEIVERAGRPELRRLIELANEGSGGVVALIADRGFGKSSLLRRLGSELDRKMLFVDCPPGGLEPLLRAFARQLHLDEDTASMERIAHRLAEEDYPLVAVDGYHHMVRPIMGALGEMDRLAELAGLAPNPILWVATLNRAAWNYVNCARGSRIALKELLELPPWPDQLIGRLIELRCRAAGIEPDFSRIRLSRLLAEGEFETIAERNRAGLYRLIQDIAQGSPAAAIRIWADSLAVAPDGTVVARLPELPAASGLETGRMNHLLVLRVILQCDRATNQEIAASLRYSPIEVGAAVRFLSQGGWIETIDDHCRITDRRYNEVIRALNRRNLISTSEGVGVL